MLCRFILLFATVTTSLVGLAPAAQADTSPRFTGQGVAFDYPADWKTRVQEIPDGYLIFVDEPGGAVTIITTFKKDLDASLEDFTSNYIKNLGSGLPPNASIKFTGKSVRSGMNEVKFVLTFQGASWPTTANLSKHLTGRRTVFCVTQAFDQNRPQVQAGFDQIRRSLAPAPEKAAH